MRIGIVSGSHRPTSESGKVARYTQKEIERLGYHTHLVDLGRTPLPLWDDAIWKNDPKILSIWSPISQTMALCDAYVIVSAEWGGMVPAGLKNFFLYALDGCLYHKPGLIVGVSASRNGAYPIAELRMSSYKNTHIQYISEHVIIRNVGKVLNEDTPESEEDSFTRKRLDYGYKVLIEYAKALKLVRESGVLNRKEFTNGM